MMQTITQEALIARPPPQWGRLDLASRSSGCARLGGEVAPPLGVVVEEVAVLVVLVRRHRAAVRRAVDDEVSSAIKEETGPAAVRRVSPGLLDARPVHALGAPGIIVLFAQKLDLTFAVFQTAALPLRRPPPLRGEDKRQAPP